MTPQSDHDDASRPDQTPEADAVAIPDEAWPGNVPAAALEEYEPPRRRRWPYVVLLLVLALGGLVAAAPLLISSAWLNGEIRSWLKNNLETPADFQKLDVSWSEGVRLTGLSVYESKSSKDPLLYTGMVEMDVAILPLLARRLEVKKLVFTDPVVRVAQNADGSLRSDDVVKTEKVKKKRGDETEEVVVLPEIDVPIEVRNLTFLFVDAEGREVERPGIEFAGHLTTRAGPTTFRLRVPDGEGQLALDGEAVLFGPEGAVLPVEQIEVRSKLRFEDLDAESNRDLLAMFMGDVRVSGHLDGVMDVTTRGGDASGSLELTLSGLAVGDVVGKRDRSSKDLRVTARFAKTGERFELRDTALQAEGLEARAEVSGPLDGLDGSATFHADLVKASAALRALGVDVPEGVEGLVDGELRFVPRPAGATGSLTVRGVRLPPAVPGGGAFVLERADAALDARLAGERVEIVRAELRLPDGTFESAGWVGKDGTLDLRTVASADVGALIVRARDLGVAPRDLALAGSLNARVVARREAADPGVGLTIETLALRGDGVAVDVTGSVAPDGALDISTRGDGAIEKLLAAGGTSSAGGVDLSSVRGRFAFAAQVTGRPDAPRAVLESLRIDGDLQVDASGRMEPDGSLEARLLVQGAIADAVGLARGLGFVEGEIPLDGRIDARVTAGGTRDAPTVSEAVLRITDGPVTVDASGSLDAAGRVSATATADVALDAVLRIAQAQGFVEHAPVTGGRLLAHAVIGGQRDAPEVLDASATVSGPLDATLEGALSAPPRVVRGRVQFKGALQPLANLAAGLRGEPAQEIAGDLEGAASVDGALDALQIALQRLQIRSAGLTASASGAYRPDGSGNLAVEVKGPLDGLFDLVHAAGIAGHIGGTGTLDAALEARVSGKGDAQAATGSLTASVRNVVLLNAERPDAVLREADLRLAVPAVRYEVAAGRTSGPVQATVTTASGLRVDVQAAGGLGDEPLAVDVNVTGPVQPLLDAAAFATGGTRATVPGMLEATARVEGAIEAPNARLRRLRFQSDALTAEAEGSATGLGTESMSATGSATVRGALAPLLAMVRTAGVAQDLEADGVLDATARLDSFAKGVATATLEATARDVVLARPPVAGAPFREPEVRVARTTVTVETATGRVRPFQTELRMKGLEAVARIEVVPGIAVAPAETTDAPPKPLHVTVDGGRLKLTSEFVRNHPELFPQTQLQGAEGTFSFHGDVARGLDGAESWTGAFDLVATGLAVPFVEAPRTTVKGTIAGGEVRVESLDAQVNGGTAKGTAVLGLVGEKPAHSATLNAQGIALRGDLAAVLSRVSPILAVGDAGRAGGTTGIQADFTAKGLDADTLKRSLNGQGTLTLTEVFAESGNWIGKVLELVGQSGGRIDVSNATVPFEVRRGQVTTQPVGMTGGSLDLLLGGTVGLDGGLDYTFKVRPKKRGGSFDRYASVLDPEGYLPLRLAGQISDPDLKLPSLGDVVKGGLGGLLDGLKDKLDPRKDEPKKDDPKKEPPPPAADGDEDDGTDEDGKPRKKRNKKRDRE